MGDELKQLKAGFRICSLQSWGSAAKGFTTFLLFTVSSPPKQDVFTSALVLVFCLVTIL
jgi:hypothetical protein